MAGLNETPSGDRVRLAFFGRRNAGKSSLINALTGQEVAIVSDVPGTTTDPVSKAMEILPLGPCLLTDTAGLDDEGALGAERVRRAREVLAATDIAVIVTADALGPLENDLIADCTRRRIPYLVYTRGDDLDAFRKRIAALAPADPPRPLVSDLVSPGDCVVCVCPIDSAAPKGRLILPQQQVIRELLDGGASAFVCRETELAATLAKLASPPRFVVTDSQAFGAVRRALAGRDVRLTSFSILFARQKGDLAAFLKGAEAVKGLRDDDTVLVAEGCTHHRQCNDIGAVKIPKALEKLSGGKRINVVFASGATFGLSGRADVSLVVHCGGCMLTRREVLRRIDFARAANVPIVNYGVLLAAANGLTDVSADGLVAP